MAKVKEAIFDGHDFTSDRSVGGEGLDDCITNVFLQVAAEYDRAGLFSLGCVDVSKSSARQRGHVVMMSASNTFSPKISNKPIVPAALTALKLLLQPVSTVSCVPDTLLTALPILNLHHDQAALKIAEPLNLLSSWIRTASGLRTYIDSLSRSKEEKHRAPRSTG